MNTRSQERKKGDSCNYFYIAQVKSNRDVIYTLKTNFIFAQVNSFENTLLILAHLRLWVWVGESLFW